ncbi:MAG: serine--tRNA ligase, partial [Candidatus Rokubacteria bacterium]|nr:serine--tRNA ligase [Candidatus Rokubacteria bacterium]
MLDIKLIRENPEAVERGLADRGGADLVRPVLLQDAARRRLVRESEDLKALRNKASEEIGRAKRRGEDAAAEQTRMREVGERIKALEAALKGVDTEIERLLLQIPNLPAAVVPPGQTEDKNVEVRRWGARREFGFAPKPHEEIGEALGLMDFERAARMSKSRFVVLWGPLARLERALADFMLDLHTREHGYTEVWVPHLVNATT